MFGIPRISRYTGTTPHELPAEAIQQAIPRCEEPSHSIAVARGDGSATLAPNIVGSENISCNIPVVKNHVASHIKEKEVKKSSSLPRKQKGPNHLKHGQGKVTLVKKEIEDKKNIPNKVDSYPLVALDMQCKVFDSDEEVMPDQGQVKQPAVRRLPFGTSLAKPSLVNIQPQGKVRKPSYDPISAMNLRKATMARHDKLRADYATCVR